MIGARSRSAIDFVGVASLLRQTLLPPQTLCLTAGYHLTVGYANANANENSIRIITVWIINLGIGNLFSLGSLLQNRSYPSVLDCFLTAQLLYTYVNSFFTYDTVSSKVKNLTTVSIGSN
jgi:hypothetical protein